MTDDEIKNVILEVVYNLTPVKSVDLVIAVADKLRQLDRRLDRHRLDSIPRYIEELVTSKDIVEIEYILPTMRYRIKSLYFCKDTVVRVPNSSVA